MDFCEPEKGKEDRGRYTKAKMNVEAGEILLVARQFAFCLAVSSSPDNWHFCCR